MRLKITRYNWKVDSLYEFKNLIGNLDDGVYNAINFFVGEDKRFKMALVRVNWEEALAGAAVVLFRVLELHQPKSDDRTRIDSVMKLIRHFSDGTSPKLTSMTAAVAADIFDFLALRNNTDAMTYLADELIKQASTETGLRTIQLILAPKTALESSVCTTLYPELRKAVERQGEFAEWFEAHIPKNLKLRAYKSTQFDEARVNATKRQRGEMLEMAMGL